VLKALARHVNDLEEGAGSLSGSRIENVVGKVCGCKIKNKKIKTRKEKKKDDAKEEN
jgi:hypothetical protein